MRARARSSSGNRARVSPFSKHGLFGRWRLRRVRLCARVRETYVAVRYRHKGDEKQHGGACFRYTKSSRRVSRRIFVTKFVSSGLRVRVNGQPTTPPTGNVPVVVPTVVFRTFQISGTRPDHVLSTIEHEPCGGRPARRLLLLQLFGFRTFRSIRARGCRRSVLFPSRPFIILLLPRRVSWPDVGPRVSRPV